MSGLKNSCWVQWDRQESVSRANRAYVELNNLYLSIERGATPLTITTANQLRVLAVQSQGDERPQDDFQAQMVSTIQQYWMNEFEKLPDWLDV